jgi:hypothetical protein
MKSSEGFIRYQPGRTEKTSLLLYAVFCHAQRIGEKKINNELWLGRVIDKENNIFFNYKDNYFKFTIENGKQILTKEQLNSYKQFDQSNKPTKKLQKNSKSVVFGDIYIVNQFISNFGLLNLFKTACIDNLDTLLLMILLRILTDYPNSAAFDFWEDTAAFYLFPHAKVQSQRISEFLDYIGTEEVHQTFFSNYINFIRAMNPKVVALIDSTGLQNSIKMSLTAINNHNGVINNEVRLISVVDKNSGFPVYYRYVPGNIVDVSTLKMVVSELHQYKVIIDHAILDAGYYSEENISLLHKNNIKFLTRMSARKGIYESLLRQYIPNIKTGANYIAYGERTLFVQKVKITLTNSQIPVNCYICLDNEKYQLDYLTYYSKFDKNISKEKHELDSLKFGVFILISTLDLEISDLLPTYYNRQTVEQIFDYMKNDANMLPLGNHIVSTFSGHIMISFMATICVVALNNALKDHNISFSSAIRRLKTYCCKVYDNFMSTDVPTKKVNDILKALKITIPTRIYFDNK